MPKKRGVVAPKGFTRRYGGTIAARIGVVGRDGLDACVYRGTVPPKDRTPPKSHAPKTLPGEEYETARPLPPIDNVVADLPDPAAGPSNDAAPAQPSANEAVPAPEPAPAEPGNGF